MNKIDKLRKKILKSENFCFYPFLELSTRPNGAVFPCCYFDEKIAVSKLDQVTKETPIESFWNNKKTISIRNALANDEKLVGCEICYRDKNSSMRARSIREYINDRKVLTAVNETIENNGHAVHLPKRLEIKPNNLCNLKCIMCNAYDSSQIEKELNELGKKFNGVTLYGGRLHEINVGLPGAWEGPVGVYELPDMSKFDWSESEEFWNSLVNLLPYVEVLSFAGGEPTLNPIVHKILQYCVEKKYSKNIHVFISSNFTNLNKKFFQLMPEYKKFELIASIDGIGEVQEYLRFPSNWNMIDTNFQKAKEYIENPNVKILVNITVNILNIAYLTDLLYWIEYQANRYPYYSEWPYNINLLNYPEPLRIDWIPYNLRQEIIDDIKKYQKSSLILDFFPELKIKTDLLIDQLSKKDYKEEEAKQQLNMLQSVVNTLDNHRNIDYKKSIPFLEKILKQI